LAPDIDYAQWREVGRALGRLIASTGSWALADWWISGQFSHSERRRLIEAADWDGPSFANCRMPEAWRARSQCQVDMTL
jgi:hypothetical protein